MDQYFEKHVILNHSCYERTREKYSLSTLEGFWTILKRAIAGQYHKISKEHLQDYLNELTFKRNNHGTNLFNVLINNMLKTNPAFI